MVIRTLSFLALVRRAPGAVARTRARRAMAEEGEHITADIAVVVTDIGANLGSVNGRVRCDGGPDGGRFETFVLEKQLEKSALTSALSFRRESYGAVTEMVPNYC